MKLTGMVKLHLIIKQVSWFKSSLLCMIDLQIYKHYNYIKTKLNLKLFSKEIRRPSKGSLGLDRQSALIKREVRAPLIIMKDGVS